MLQFLIFLVLFARGSSVGEPQACLTKCHCFTEVRSPKVPVSWTTINCSQQNLGELLPTSNFTTENIIIDLNFSKNGIKTVGDQLNSSTFSNLRRLDLSSNQIETIADKAFDSLQYLVLLDLSHNHLAKFERKLISNLIDLRKLILSHNQLTTLEPNIFDENRALVNLALDNNKFRHIDHSWIDYLDHLDDLDLSGNQFYEFELRLFANVKTLSKIDISYNQFQTVPTSSLRQLRNLRVLKIGGNPIDTINGDTFEELTTLEELSISNMDKLLGIERAAFSDLCNLTQLSIDHNRYLTYIDKNAFIGMKMAEKRCPTLRKLSMVDNKLETLYEHSLAWCSIDELDLRMNRWRCDCKLYWLKKCQQAAIAKCSKPDILAGIEIIAANKRHFTCEPRLSHENLTSYNALILGGFTMMLVLTGLFIGVYIHMTRKRRFIERRDGKIGYIYYKPPPKQDEKVTLPQDRDLFDM